MESVACNNCGAINESGASICSNCNSPISTQPPQGQASSTPQWKPGNDMSDYGRQVWTKEIDRTRTGLFLLTVGLFISWIPYVQYIGGLLVFIGAILVILGRRAFGDKHSTYVVLAFVVFIISMVVSGAMASVFALSIASTLTSPNPPTGQALIAQLDGGLASLLAGVIVASIIGTIAYILLSFELQAQIGKQVLIAAFIASVVIGIAMFALALPVLESVVSTAVQGGTTINVAAEIQGKLLLFQLLDAIPDILLGTGFYLAYKRVLNHEIPAHATASTTQ